jgi:hypothetical protein
MAHESTHEGTVGQRRALPASVVVRKPGAEPSGAYALRRRVGNQGVQRLVSEAVDHSKGGAQTRSPTIQAKLTISDPGDAHEREADRMADSVMRMPAAQAQRKCTDCEEERKHNASPQVQSAGGSGASPDGATRAFRLAHVVQHSDGDATRISRTANPASFNCPASANGAPASPFGDIDAVDRNAQGLATATSIFATLSAILDPTTGFGTFDSAYRDRFGPPTQVGTRFRNRFTGALLGTAREAAQQEVSMVADRLDRISTFLGGSIRYTCRAGGVAFNHSNCTSTCAAGDVAYTCAPIDLRRIEICPGFWGLAANQQAIAIIHEAGHMLFNFTAHGSGSLAQRGRNPECYASLVADSFGITPFDGRCPRI